MNDLVWPIVIALSAILVLFVYSRLTTNHSKVTINGKRLPGPIALVVSITGLLFALFIILTVFTFVGLFLLGLPVFFLLIFSLIIVAVVGVLLLLPLLIFSLIAFGTVKALFR